MSTTAMVRCDGTPDIRPTIPLGQCRAAYPARATDPHDAIVEATQHGWTSYGLKDLCPSCSRYR